MSNVEGQTLKELYLKFRSDYAGFAASDKSLPGRAGRVDECILFPMRLSMTLEACITQCKATPNNIGAQAELGTNLLASKAAIIKASIETS